MKTHPLWRKEIATGLVLILLSVMLILEFLDISFLASCEGEGWQVDVYTQKEPYSGAGLGEPSDSFEPQQVVLLHANVTYNLGPRQNVRVSFSVKGPPNPVENYTLVLSAVTDDVGVARTDFTLPWPPTDPETITLGLWNVTTSIEDASDFLIFRVGWIVDLSSLSIVDEDPPQGGWLEVDVSFTNIAMTFRNATLSLESSDSANLIFTLVVEDIELGPGSTNLTIRFNVPRWATVGMATLNASVFTPDGEPYSPTTLSATFLISLLGDLNGDNKVEMWDIGIAALAFGSDPDHPRWNPLADINKDGRVNIMDIALVAQNLGKTYP